MLYNKKKKLTKELIVQILDLKNNMNTNRSNFVMPENHINITKSWLLGFIEGDGSFSLLRNSLEPVFSIKLTEKELPVLIKIKEYLENNLGFDLYSMHKLRISPIIGIGTEKTGHNNSKPLATFMIKNLHFLNNYLIPYLTDPTQNFLTKKGEDFNDFKIICRTIYNGAHRKDDIKELILKLSYTMNNYRLSTYSGVIVNLNENELNILINAAPTIEHLHDGRQRDILTKKIVHRRSSSCIYEIIKPSGELLIASNLAEAAKIAGVGFNTLKKHLDIEILECHHIKVSDYKIKRIPVFYPKKKGLSKDKILK